MKRTVPLRLIIPNCRPVGKSVNRANEKIEDPEIPEVSPSVSELREFWERKWRPNVVLCVTHKKRILLCLTARYRLWQLPQGGVEPGETVEEAIAWELSEELGTDFAKQCSNKLHFLFADKLRFRGKQKVSINPIGEEKGELKINGKLYFFYQLAALEDTISADQTQFDEIRWCSSEEAFKLIEQSNQPSKQRQSYHAIEHLKQLGLID